MLYQSLYRKYRPKNLNEVYGQDIVVKILTNAVKYEKFSHAYLFTGSRGCGKTSVARILARMINCENLKEGMPCEECNSCKESSLNNCVDIIEMDAASNNGVDEIRDLKQNIYISPSSLKYKIYIIDEVHMLSIGAFNALLKILEEPPEHAVFILATTDIEKVPTTIISRCQVLEFKKINNNDMFKRLKEICDKENIKITDEAINEIILNSDGGLRDAIGLLDLATSYAESEINEEMIQLLSGSISSSEIKEICDLLINNEYDKVVEYIDNYSSSGRDLIKIIDRIIEELNNRIIKNYNDDIVEINRCLIEAETQMKKSNLAKNIFELSIMSLNKKSNVSRETITETNKVEPLESVDIIENNEKTVEIKEVINTPAPTKNIDKLKRIRINNTLAGANKKLKENLEEKWKQLEDYTLDKKVGSLVCELLDSTPTVVSDKNVILTYSYDSFVDKGNMYLKEYENVIKDILNLDLKIIFMTNTDWNKTKKEYVYNLKNNIPYNYMEENDVELDNEVQENEQQEENDDIIKKMSELFDDSKIEIEER